MSLNFVFVLIFSFFIQLTLNANDGAIGLDGGNLVFKNLKGVSMQKEELYISEEIVRVRYEFMNTTEQAIETHIAFPIRWTDDCGDKNFDWKSDNPLKFTASVDSKTIDTKLKKEGFDASTENDCGRELSLTHYWHQVFPAKKKLVIEHSYVPVFSSSVEDSMEDNIWDENTAKNFKQKFCPSDLQLNKIKSKNLKYKGLHYILKTALTWDGPIGEFELKIDKAKNKYLFLCTELDIKKWKNTNIFRATAKNFVPSSDLDIAFMK